MRQNVSDLLAFVAIARERSFTNAAAGFGISQSALSHTTANWNPGLDDEEEGATQTDYRAEKAPERRGDNRDERIAAMESRRTPGI